MGVKNSLTKEKCFPQERIFPFPGVESALLGVIGTMADGTVYGVPDVLFSNVKACPKFDVERK